MTIYLMVYLLSFIGATAIVLEDTLRITTRITIKNVIVAMLLSMVPIFNTIGILTYIWNIDKIQGLLKTPVWTRK